MKGHITTTGHIDLTCGLCAERLLQCPCMDHPLLIVTLCRRCESVVYDAWIQAHEVIAEARRAEVLRLEDLHPADHQVW